MIKKIGTIKPQKIKWKTCRRDIARTWRVLYMHVVFGSKMEWWRAYGRNSDELARIGIVSWASMFQEKLLVMEESEKQADGKKGKKV